MSNVPNQAKSFLKANKNEGGIPWLDIVRIRGKLMQGVFKKKETKQRLRWKKVKNVSKIMTNPGNIQKQMDLENG